MDEYETPAPRGGEGLPFTLNTKKPITHAPYCLFHDGSWEEEVISPCIQTQCYQTEQRGDDLNLD